MVKGDDVGLGLLSRSEACALAGPFEQLIGGVPSAEENLLRLYKVQQAVAHTDAG